MNNQLKILQQKVNQLEQENNLLKQLHTKTGFFAHYFSLLPDYKTFTGAFEKANQDYYDLFGEYRYADYRNFQRQLNKHNE